MLVAQTVVPMLEKNSSGGSHNSDPDDFWEKVEEEIEDSKGGEIVEIEISKNDKLPSSIIDTLIQNPDVGIIITNNGKVVVEIPAGTVIVNQDGRVSYTIEELIALYGKAPVADVPAEEVPEVIPAPEEGPEQPEEPSAVAPEAPQQEADEPEQPTLEETEEDPSSGSANGAVIGIAVASLAAATAGFTFFFRKKRKR